MKKKFILMAAVICCTLIFTAGCNNKGPHTEKGRLFLDRSSLDSRETLTGEWEFYNGVLCSVNNFDRPWMSSNLQYADYTSNWLSTLLSSSSPPEKDYATYRLLISTPQNMADNLFIRIPYNVVPVTIFSNSTMIFSNAAVGDSSQLTGIQNSYPYIAEVMPVNGSIDLVVHISGYRFPGGGPREPLIIGTRDSILRYNDILTSINIFVIGSLLIMTIYNLIIFFIAKKLKSSLFFSLFCISSAVHIFVSGTSLLSRFGIQSESILKIYYISIIMALYFFFRYFTAVFKNYRRDTVTAVCTAGTIIICLSAIIVHSGVLYYFYYPVMSLYILSMLIFSAISVRELINKNENSYMFLYSFIAIFTLMLFDSIPGIGISQFNSAAPAGFVFFCIIQSIITGRELNRQLTANRELSEVLTRKNEELSTMNTGLEKRIEERTGELREQNRIVSEQNTLIKEINLTLEKRIRDAVEDLRNKDDILTITSRQAVMGEMISFIGHQWKQNIYAISLYTEALKNILVQKGSLSVERAKDPLDKIDSFIIEMYNNLNDFIDFIRPGKEPDFFSITGAIEETLLLMKDYITINSIEVIRDYSGEPSTSGFSNELKQVLMNLLKNSIDAFNERKITDRIIVISIHSDGEFNCIRVMDNAGGIPLANPDGVFEKFYTTKKGGTGLGLYLSRILIKKRFSGSLEVRNKDGGASFTISIPVHTENTVL